MVAKALSGIALTTAVGVVWWLRSHGAPLADHRHGLRQESEPRFEWRPVERRHWQAIGRSGAGPLEGGEPPEATDSREGNAAGCRAGMVRVKGAYRLDSVGEETVERIQNGACTDWISRDFPARCRVFDKQKLARDVAKLPTRSLDFCMDRFEYPNVLGQNPVIVVTFREAGALCKKASKRLCTENEWTFACEGEEARPYPYGWTRDATACVVDRTWRPFTEGALQPRDGAGARAELDRLWQAEPSGARSSCKSPFGVYDMTGNVDEWTRSVRSTGFSSILKGGYWGPVRARCRPATRAHNEDFVAYQQGFRCCAEADASVEAPRPAPPSGEEKEELASVAADAGPSSSPSMEEVASAAQDGDEVEALSRARVRFACDSAPGPNSSGAWLLATFTGLIMASRARRRSAR